MGFESIEKDFALVTVKNRENGTLNPNPRLQKTVTVEEVLASRMIAKPLRFLNACPNSGVVILKR